MKQSFKPERPEWKEWLKVLLPWPFEDSGSPGKASLDECREHKSQEQVGKEFPVGFEDGDPASFTESADAWSIEA